MRKFNTSNNGYNKEEVNSFVNEVTNEYESMLNKLKNKDLEITSLKEQLNHYKNIESTLNKTLLIAEDSSNQIKSVAREEAKDIIKRAKTNASQIVNDALLKAQKVDLETDQVRRSLKIYKARIKAAVEEQLTIVDDVDEIKMRDS